MSAQRTYDELLEKINEQKEQEKVFRSVIQQVEGLYAPLVTQYLEMANKNQHLYDEILNKVEEQEEQEKTFLSVIQQIEVLYTQVASSQIEIEKKNKQLQEEIAERKRVEMELQKAKQETEKSLIHLEALSGEIQELNRSLADKVKQQVEEIERVGRLKRYLSPLVVQKVVEKKADMGIVSNRKNLTVLFSDIRGFTSATETMEPESAIELLNEYLSEMTKIIYEEGGTLDKFMGDGIMAFYGDPIEYEDHAKRAVNTALKMQERLKELQEKWHSDGQEILKIGIGISTGYVTVGNIGCEDHLDYTVIGNNVNLAARLQSLAKEGEIIISPRTYASVKDMISAEEVGKIEIKGFHKPVDVYKVLGVLEAVTEQKLRQQTT